MDRARRLPSTEDIEKKGVAGIKPWRHGQSGKNHDGAEGEYNDEVGEFLKDVVVLGFFASREAQSEMIPERTANLSKVRS